MFAILKKEISSFFASPVGYLVILVFLILNGLFLWVFKGSYNIFDNGVADLSAFFSIAPWVMLFLIPALTMKSFSDERRQGTLELLLTKPLEKKDLVTGKFLGAFLLVIMALLPTLLYVWTVWSLSNPVGNIDTGSIMGSYFGLLFLAGSYCAIGIFASTLSENQIVAFITSVVLCFFLYYGLESIAQFVSGDMGQWITALGMKAHFDSIARGVIDTRDILYFVSIGIFFLVLTASRLDVR